MQQQAIPKELNLGAIKPAAIPAYTRRVVSIATNAQTFTENMLANVLLDTSTPGSFLDPTQSLLTFDLQNINLNPYVDYVNFSTSGAASLIQEFRVICQGTPIEEILDYNMMFEMWMDLGGHAQEEFKMYVENSWRAPTMPGQPDWNFVKPPMIDREGVIMCPNPINQFGNVSKVHNESGRYLLQKNGLYTSGQTDINGVNGGNALSSGAATYSTTSDYKYSYNQDDFNNCLSLAPGTIRTQTWTNRIDNTYVTWPSTIRPEIKNQNMQVNPVQDIGQKRYRLQDYMMFLANVKNIPVGIAPAKSFLMSDAACSEDGQLLASNWNFNQYSTNSGGVHMTGSSTSRFNICLPIFSGIIGLWAEKAFPTMLIAPGSLYLQIKWAKAVHAFQLAQDPCRRVFGTFRDYVPNYGSPLYFPSETGGATTVNARTSVSTTIGSSAYTSDGKTAQTTPRLALTIPGANGTDYAYMEYVPSSGQSTSYGIGSCTGNAKPQYVPIDTPWVYGGQWALSGNTISGTNNYCEETAISFGTYLPCSTSQVRRCFVGDQFNNKLSSIPPNSTFGGNNTTYSIQNLSYVGLQIILPDEITASLVKMAADGDISLHAHSCRTYKVQTNTSTSQSIILPIKIASACSLYILFQNTIMLDNPYYCGMTRNNPMVGFQWTPAPTYFVGSDTAPTIALGSGATNSPFSIQLRLGNELLPLQPITEINQVIYELERSVHGSQDMWASVPTIGSFRHFRTDFSSNGTNNAISGLSKNEYLTLKNNDFQTPFIPIAALDDQTITDNPSFRDYMSTYNATFSSATFIQAKNRGKYVLNQFIPPISKFMLGFDLETFSNQGDVARSGRYLGNGPITLVMTNTFGAGQPSTAYTATDVFNVLAVCYHDIRFSIMPGGQVLAYY